MQVSEMQVRDIMVPRAQMDVIDIDDTPDRFIPHVIATAHSRFPVIDRDRDDVIGILLAKDLLRYYAGEEEFNVRDMLRPAVFVPESKRLNVLLREFRANRNHMAIVVDEYGGVAGLVTIEDVLEQIVGDIEDEYDLDETEDNILQEGTEPLARQGAHRDRRVQRGDRHGLFRRGFRHRRRTGAAPVRAAAQARRIDHHRGPAVHGAAGRQPPPAPALGAETSRARLRLTRSSTPPAAPLRHLAAFAAGAAAVAAFAPVQWSPLAPLALAFLFHLWLRADSPRRAALLGYAFGLGHFGAGVSWIYVSLHDFGAMPAPLAAIATALYCAYLALFPALVGSLQARLGAVRPCASSCSFPALWMLAEWLRGWLLTGFPWLAAGYSQIDTPLAGFAPLLGVYGVSFALVLLAGLIVLLATGQRRLARVIARSRGHRRAARGRMARCARSNGLRRRAIRSRSRWCRATSRRA